MYLDEANAARDRAKKNLSQFQAASQPLYDLFSDWWVAQQQDSAEIKKFSTHIADLNAMQLELQRQLLFTTKAVYRQKQAMGIRKPGGFRTKSLIGETTTELVTGILPVKLRSRANKQNSPLHQASLCQPRP